MKKVYIEAKVKIILLVSDDKTIETAIDNFAELISNEFYGIDEYLVTDCYLADYKIDDVK